MIEYDTYLEFSQFISMSLTKFRYSAHFIGDVWDDLVLAAGTVFNQVVLWKASDRCNAEGRNPVLHRLTGHTVSKYA